MPPAIHSTMTASAVGDERLGSGLRRSDGARKAGRQRRQRRRAGRRQEVAAGQSRLTQCTNWNSGSITTLQSRSSTPAAVRLRAQQLRRTARAPRDVGGRAERALEHACRSARPWLCGRVEPGASRRGAASSASVGPFASSRLCSVVAADARVVTTCSRFGRPSAVISGSAYRRARRASDPAAGAACALTSVDSRPVAGQLLLPDAGDRADAVDELLGRQPPDRRAAEHVRLRPLGHVDGLDAGTRRDVRMTVIVRFRS